MFGDARLKRWPKNLKCSRIVGAKYVFIVDAVFNSSAEHVAGICEAIIQKDLKLKWGCFLHPKNLTPELMRMMARAGLTHIEFGSDSLCDPCAGGLRKALYVRGYLRIERTGASRKNRLLPFSDPAAGRAKRGRRLSWVLRIRNDCKMLRYWR